MSRLRNTILISGSLVGITALMLALLAWWVSALKTSTSSVEALGAGGKETRRVAEDASVRQALPEPAAVDAVPITPSPPSPPKEESAQLPQTVKRGTTVDMRPQAELSPTGGLQSRIDELAQSAAVLSLEMAWKRVEELRKEVVQVSDSSVSSGMQERLDLVILAALNARSSVIVARAVQQYEAKDFAGVAKSCEEALAVYQAKDIPPFNRPLTNDPRPKAQAQALLAKARQMQGMLEHPDERYRIRGFFKSPRGATARLEDALTGDRIQVRVGDYVGLYRVESLDDKQGRVILQRGSETIRITE